MIKAVFLDVGGVVLKIDWTNPLKLLGVPNSRRPEIVELLKNWDVFHRFEKGTADPREFFAGINGLLGLRASEEELREAWNALIVGELPGARELIQEIRAAGLPVFALSNTNAVHDKFQFQHYSILKEFDHFHKSYLMGERKPGSKIYELAARHAGLRPSECLFIDDTQENVDGAAASGWLAYKTVDDTVASIDVIRRELKKT